MRVDDSDPLCRRIVHTLTVRSQTVGTAESLTGGLVCAGLTAIPGASAVVLGAVVSYDLRIKAEVLGVDRGLLERVGAIDPGVALAMAVGVRRLLGATYAVSTTGAAGPDPAPGGSAAPEVAAGRGFVALAGPGGEVVRGFDVGDRGRVQVRQAAVHAALELLLEELG